MAVVGMSMGAFGAMHLTPPMRMSEAATLPSARGSPTAAACGGGGRSCAAATEGVTPAPSLPSLASLLPEGMPLEGPPKEWFMAVAPAVAVMERIVTRYFPDVAQYYIPPECESVVGVLRRRGQDDAASKLQAAWDDLCASEGGRAVAAVCKIAMDEVFLGDSFAEELAADTCLEDKLCALYDGKTFLPALLAATRYCRAQAASGEGAAAAGGAGGK